jgi:hypothetical protein
MDMKDSEYCFLCCDSDVHHSDRWRFELVDEDESQVDQFWLCRVCHGKFSGVEAFDKFRQDFLKLKLYRQAARLQKLLLLGAPSTILQNEVKVMVGRLMYDEEGRMDEQFRDSIRSLEDSNA